MTQNKKLAARISKAKELDGGAPVLLSVHEAAARLRVGRSTMQGLIATGKIRSMKIGRVRRVSVENQTIDPFVERGEHSAERLDRIVAVLERSGS
jgi:excisionase family DNA binding protein